MTKSVSSPEDVIERSSSCIKYPRGDLIQELLVTHLQDLIQILSFSTFLIKWNAVINFDCLRKLCLSERRTNLRAATVTAMGLSHSKSLLMGLIQGSTWSSTCRWFLMMDISSPNLKPPARSLISTPLMRCPCLSPTERLERTCCHRCFQNCARS